MECLKTLETTENYRETESTVRANVEGRQKDNKQYLPDPTGPRNISLIETGVANTEPTQIQDLI